MVVPVRLVECPGSTSGEGEGEEASALLRRHLVLGGTPPRSLRDLLSRACCLPHRGKARERTSSHSMREDSRDTTRSRRSTALLPEWDLLGWGHLPGWVVGDRLAWDPRAWDLREWEARPLEWEGRREWEEGHPGCTLEEAHHPEWDHLACIQTNGDTSETDENEKNKNKNK